MKGYKLYVNSKQTLQNAYSGDGENDPAIMYPEKREVAQRILDTALFPDSKCGWIEKNAQIIVYVAHKFLCRPKGTGMKINLRLFNCYFILHGLTSKQKALGDPQEKDRL